MLEADASGRLPPVIDSVWPFEQLAEAQDEWRDGSFFGKLVVTFDDASG